MISRAPETIDGITSGERFDWYYASEGDRIAQNRTPIEDSITPGAGGKVARFADHLVGKLLHIGVQAHVIVGREFEHGVRIERAAKLVQGFQLGHLIILRQFGRDGFIGILPDLGK